MSNGGTVLQAGMIERPAAQEIITQDIGFAEFFLVTTW
jgi:hypothetical protein